MTNVKRVRRVLVGRELELDCVKKVHAQLDRLPDTRSVVRVLGYITAATDKQQDLPNMPNPPTVGSLGF